MVLHESCGAGYDVVSLILIAQRILKYLSFEALGNERPGHAAQGKGLGVPECDSPLPCPPVSTWSTAGRGEGSMSP